MELFKILSKTHRLYCASAMPKCCICVDLQPENGYDCVIDNYWFWLHHWAENVPQISTNIHLNLKQLLQTTNFYMCIVFNLSYQIFSTCYVVVQLYYFTSGTIWYFSLLCCVVMKQRKIPNCFKCKTEPWHTYNTNTWHFPVQFETAIHALWLNDWKPI